jgi:hypothetical protein
MDKTEFTHYWGIWREHRHCLHPKYSDKRDDHLLMQRGIGEGAVAWGACCPVACIFRWHCASSNPFGTFAVKH